MPEIDMMDLRILALLQKDGRISNVDLADQVALSPSPCLRRVKRLENEGVVLGYRAILAREAVGLGLTVFAAIKVARHSREAAAALQEALAALPEVVSCHMVSGEADFLAEIVVPDLVAYERLLTDRLLTLPMISDIRSNFSLRRVKSEAPLPIRAAASLGPQTKPAGEDPGQLRDQQ
ncbi:MAG TPA: Lrp/AsnC family transcriptional regulator [Geminicoccus sp.]|jgi:Lrp/AsnC family leucine-responsive transcriptional regulator|uniref:Lrp/AsnC family transcriptional regulator n=1 Tax=Geminicoccus sp. TaxID=2024832 RepID=UPI002E31A1A2|nr:Lrp/AsnC family transcriptional regulator [Geminicoccus sp.]HEX2527050.1 Lrp/AsnC family transcriptional regulator [Geminicoccus sp.]